MLTLYRNGHPVDHPPFWVGADFHYAEGKIGITAQDGWTYAQQLLEEGPDGEAVVVGIVNWSVVAVPVDESIPPTPEQIRAAMPVIYPTDFARLLKGLLTENYPNGVLPSDVEAIIDAIPDQATRELARWDFNRAGKFERSNEWMDVIGAAFPMTPEEMDAAWMSFVEALNA